MKRCPKCNADYFDNMLEFCLEDGTKLIFAPQSAVSAPPTVAAETHRTPGPIAHNLSEETVVIPAERKQPADRADQAPRQSSNLHVLERAAVGFALAHNWWQWLYLEKAYVYSVADYLLSANFLMWLLLLAAGIVTGMYAVKQSRDKTLGIIGLVIVAINLILFVVPRR